MDKCDKCGTELECHAGCSAHHSNWYCPECTSKRTKTMSKILPFTGVTKLPVPVDKVLDNTPRDLQSVIILGYDSNDEFYFSSSIPEGPEILWLLEQAKTELLRICEDKDNG